MATWAQQIAAAGVFQSKRFGELPNLGPQIVGYLTEGEYGWGPGGFGEIPFQDPTNGYDVGGAVRFNCNVPAPASLGEMMVRFSNDRTSPTTMNAIGCPGEGAPHSELYIAAATKWDANFWDTVHKKNDLTDQGGIKVFDVVTGWPLALSGTSSEGVVMQTYYQTKVMAPYYYGGGTTVGPRDTDAFDDVFQNQNVPGGMTCKYGGSPSLLATNSAGCWHVPRAEWFWLYLRLKITGRATSSHVDFEFDWYTWNVGDSDWTLRNTWDNTHPNYIPKRLDVGEMWGAAVFFPYMTERNQDYTDYNAGYVVNDHMIASTQPILPPNNPTFVYSALSNRRLRPHRRLGRLL